MKRHRLQRQDGFTGFVHWFNIVLEPLRRGSRSQFSKAIDSHDQRGGRIDCRPVNAIDKCVLCRLRNADAGRIRLAKSTPVTDVDIIIACGKVGTCANANCDVAAAGSDVVECKITDGCVASTGIVIFQCT